MLLAIISDTHLPRGERALPQACIEHLQAADLILHAGDFSAPSVLHELERHGPVEAVYGNADEPQLRQLLPATRLVEVEGAAIAMVHNGGPSARRLERLRARFPDADAVVFGHSHVPQHERARDGFQIFNPGSPTHRRREPHHTMGLARVREGRAEFELVVLD